MMTQPVFVDTDISLGTPGAEIDDGAALIMLMHAPSLDVRGVGTVHGNVPVEQATHNARRLLSRLGHEETPVGRGVGLPLIEDPSWFAEWQSRYGPTPPWPGGDTLPTAVELLIETVRAAPGEVSVLALGPLTNLAIAARLAPDIVHSVREVVAMGGSFGHAAPTAEFNVRCDPEAAHIVFSAGWPLRLLGLEVTRQVLFSRHDFARLPDDDRALRLLKSQAPGWIDVVEAEGWEEGGCALHDAVAVAALLDETLITYVNASVNVELADPARRGITALKPLEEGQGNGTARVAVAIEADRCHDLILSCLEGKCPS